MEKKQKGNSFIRVRLGEVIASAVLVSALVVFALWGFSKGSLTVQGAVSAALSLGMLAVGLVIAVPKALNFVKGVPELRPSTGGERSLRKRRFPPVLGVILTVLAFRVLQIIAAYIISNSISGLRGTVFSTLEEIWFKPDTEAQYFFSIAEGWYSSEKLLLYAPLFPALVRLLNHIFGSSFVSAFVLNTALTCGFCAVLYELALFDLGRRTSRLAVMFALILPAGIFFVAPMSEALFMLLSASALLAIRRERFAAAGICILLASFSRLWGIILIVPYLAEAAAYLVRAQGEKGKEGLVKRIILLSLGFTLSVIGFFLLFLVHRLAFGKWFGFVDALNASSQKPTPFFEAVGKQTDGLFSTFGRNNSASLGLWLPNLLYIFGTLVVLVASARALHTSYTLYYAVYFAVSCGMSGLVSAPRYLTAMAVLPIALALLCESRDDGEGIMRSRAKTVVVTSVLAVGQVFYLIMYVLRYNIY